jgi:signal transduction histidine kinase
LTDIILETFRASVLLGILVFLWISGRHRFERLRKGWRQIIVGFGLLLFGSLLDISDNFETLNPFIVIGDTDTEAFLEKFVGFLGGFVFLAIGLIKWIPGVQGMSDLVDARTKELQEINEVLQLEVEERKRAEKIKQEFISTVSHELRTPLTSIKGSLGLMKAGTLDKDPDKLQSMMDIAYDNSERLVLLINDILDIEKLEAGKMAYQLEPIDAVDLVKGAIEANKGFADEHGVVFVWSGTDESIQVKGDKDRLMQVMSNLMSNAAKFSATGDEVELSISREGETVCFAVKDNGPGIPEKYRESLFDKFTQVDSSDTREKGGTGLGLSITDAIVEQHGGTLDFESEVGEGSTFFFTMPIFK